MKKRIICLANSNKDLCNNSGRCIAGKDYKNHSIWIRPISSRPTEEISRKERLYKNGEEPQILDIIDIEILENRPNSFQTENQLIDHECNWVKIGTYNSDELDYLLDHPRSLWTNNESSFYGKNDRISELLTKDITNSLYFIKSSVNIDVAIEGSQFGNPQKRVRCRFKYNGNQYKLSVTDPLVKKSYINEDSGSYEMGEKYLCISLGLCYSRDNTKPKYAYLFAATIL